MMAEDSSPFRTTVVDSSRPSLVKAKNSSPSLQNPSPSPLGKVEDSMSPPPGTSEKSRLFLGKIDEGSSSRSLTKVVHHSSLFLGTIDEDSSGRSLTNVVGHSSPSPPSKTVDHSSPSPSIAVDSSSPPSQTKVVESSSPSPGTVEAEDSSPSLARVENGSP